MSGRLSGTIVERAALRPGESDRLYALFSSFYLHVDRATFDRDLAEKDHVLLLRDGEGVIRGFTTLRIFDLAFEGRRIRAVFNGNTLVEPGWWGEQALGRTWCAYMAGLRRQLPDVPLYWFLICSGFRTYLFLPLFFRSYFPRHDAATPASEARLIDFLGGLKFPEEYTGGIVRVRDARECVPRELAEPSAHKLENPHIRFFVERNPGYLRGDELVCLAEFSISNNLRYALNALAAPVEAA